LFEHLWWADAEVLEGMERSELAPAAASVELLAHVLGAELIWLDRIEGVGQSVEVWPRWDLADCRRLSETSRRRYAAYLAGLVPATLQRTVGYRNSAGDRFDSRIEDILLHVALHGAYHRGQIALGLRRASLEPSPTDFIAFTRGAPAATRADGEGRREEAE